MCILLGDLLELPAEGGVALCGDNRDDDQPVNARLARRGGHLEGGGHALLVAWGDGHEGVMCS